jgi:hypothetical protein
MPAPRPCNGPLSERTVFRWDHTIRSVGVRVGLGMRRRGGGFAETRNGWVATVARPWGMWLQRRSSTLSASVATFRKLSCDSKRTDARGSRRIGKPDFHQVVEERGAASEVGDAR